MKIEIEMKDEHAKLRELILYIAARYASNSKWGLVKLNKILAYSDFEAYRDLGQPISGEAYFKLPFGPAPKYMKRVLDEMLVANDIVEIVVSWPRGNQRRIGANRESDISKFSPEEISIVEKYIQYFWNMDAEQVSDVSHETVGWKMTYERQIIPYETAFLVNPDDIVVTEEILERAEKIAAE